MDDMWKMIRSRRVAEAGERDAAKKSAADHIKEDAMGKFSSPAFPVAGMGREEKGYFAAEGLDTSSVRP